MRPWNYCWLRVTFACESRACRNSIKYDAVGLFEPVDAPLSFQVVGGLAWSIQACNFAVDIDVLYQENAFLGQKLYVERANVLSLSKNGDC